MLEFFEPKAAEAKIDDLLARDLDPPTWCSIANRFTER